MDTPPLGSLLIGSPDVAAMKSWYTDVLVAKENEMGALTFGPIMLFIEEHSEVSGRAKDAPRIILDLDVTDVREWEKHLDSKEVTWVRRVEQTPNGLIGTVEDPDGNYVQVIQWG
jgi:hypothetical protein